MRRIRGQEGVFLCGNARCTPRTSIDPDLLSLSSDSSLYHETIWPKTRPNLALPVSCSERQRPSAGQLPAADAGFGAS